MLMGAPMRDRNQRAVVLALLGLLAATSWFCMSVLRSTPGMPFYGNVLLTGAVILMLVLGCGLIALMFYSRRKGHDEPPRSGGARRD
jgi:heme/copper-type cytochrome/quinol oxidase subunit 2